MDFGIAKTLDPSSSEYTQTGTGMQMGTPMYMSPEQVKSSRDVGPASDIYSLGVVLWQMVTGKRPYDTNTLSTFELQLKIVQERLTSTDSYWDEAIQIATDKETAKRYVTCEKFIASLGKETIEVSVHEGATVLIAGPQNDSRNPFTPSVKSEVDKDILELLGPFIKVAGGSFQMGSPSTEPLGRHDELLHAVSISDFQIQATTVSQALYERVTGKNPSKDKTWKELPVTNVSWHDANAFIEKLNALTNRSYRLPTEAEWEYATRGGSLSKGYLYSGSNNPDDIGSLRLVSIVEPRHCAASIFLSEEYFRPI